MAPLISLPTTTLPARAALCRGCLGLGLGLGLSMKSRSSPRSRSSSPLHSQKRWIGLKYLRKQKDADEVWKAQAEEIKAGTAKHLFDELQDRGFVKDLVG